MKLIIIFSIFAILLFGILVMMVTLVATGQIGAMIVGFLLVIPFIILLVPLIGAAVRLNNEK